MIKIICEKGCEWTKVNVCEVCWWISVTIWEKKKKVKLEMKCVSGKASKLMIMVVCRECGNVKCLRLCSVENPWSWGEKTPEYVWWITTIKWLYDFLVKSVIINSLFLFYMFCVLYYLFLFLVVKMIINI